MSSFNDDNRIDPQVEGWNLQSQINENEEAVAALRVIRDGVQGIHGAAIAYGFLDLAASMQAAISDEIDPQIALLSRTLAEQQAQLGEPYNA